MFKKTVALFTAARLASPIGFSSLASHLLKLMLKSLLQLSLLFVNSVFPLLHQLHLRLPQLLVKNLDISAMALILLPSVFLHFISLPHHQIPQLVDLNAQHIHGPLGLVPSSDLRVAALLQHRDALLVLSHRQQRAPQLVAELVQVRGVLLGLRPQLEDLPLQCDPPPLERRLALLVDSADLTASEPVNPQKPRH